MHNAKAGRALHVTAATATEPAKDLITVPRTAVAEGSSLEADMSTLFATFSIPFMNKDTPDYKPCEDTCIFCDTVISEIQRDNHAATKAHKRNRDCCMKWWPQFEEEGWKLVVENIDLQGTSFSCGLCRVTGDWYQCFEHRDSRVHKKFIKVTDPSPAVKHFFSEKLHILKKTGESDTDLLSFFPL